MTKKILIMAAALTLALSMVSCGDSDEKSTESADVKTTVSSADKTESTAESKAENDSVADNTSSENSEQEYQDDHIYNMHYERPVLDNEYSNVYKSYFNSFWNGSEYGFIEINPCCNGTNKCVPDENGDPLDWWEGLKDYLVLSESYAYGGPGAYLAKKDSVEWKTAEALEINGRKFVKATFSFTTAGDMHVENIIYLTCSKITSTMFTPSKTRPNPNVYGFMFTDCSGEDHMEYFDECLKHCAETLHEEKE